MIIEHFFIKSVAHNSYLLEDSKTCAIIDPSRDVEIYLEAAKSLNMKITHILETHLHADFVSGHLELLKRQMLTYTHPNLGAVLLTTSLFLKATSSR